MRILLLLTLVLHPCFVFSQNTDTEALLAQCKNYEKAEKYSKSLKIYNQLIESYPDSSNFYLYRGQNNSKLKNYEQAFKDYGKAIELDNENVMAYFERGKFFVNIGKPNSGILDFTKMLEHAKVDSLKMKAYFRRGTAKLDKRDFNASIVDLMLAYELDSLHDGLDSQIGIVLDYLGRKDEALVFLKRLVERSPEFMPGVVNLGFVLSNMERYEESIVYYDRVIENDPNEALALSNRGFAKLKLGHLAEALKDINKSLKLFPSNSYAYRSKAMIYIEMGEKETACELLHQALKLGFKRSYGNEVDELLLEHCK